MKTCTLGILYGLTPTGLAEQLGKSTSEAKTLLARFMGLFPELEAALQQAAAFGALRGYATTVSGVRRHRGRRGNASTWERNWLTNHPVQGSAPRWCSRWLAIALISSTSTITHG
jgi:DNA polymerase-1